VGEPTDTTHRFDMSLTVEDLHRLAPTLTPEAPVTHDGDAVAGGWGASGRWSIRIVDRRILSIALLRLPMAGVEIALHGLDAAEAERFLARFHLVFRRGGG